MAHHYQPRQFLMDIPNLLLKQYFDKKGLLSGVDFDGLKDESDIESIYEAWQALSTEQADRVDADFYAILDMVQEKAVDRLVEEALALGEDLGPDFKRMKDDYHRIVWTLVENPTLFETTYRFLQLTKLSSCHWHRRRNMLSAGSDATTEVSENPSTAVSQGIISTDLSDYEICARNLEEAVSEYYRKVFGLEASCKVETYIRSGMLHLFTYVESCARDCYSFNKLGDLERQLIKPASLVVYVYSFDKDWLDTYCEESDDIRHAMQNLFSEYILDKTLSDVAGSNIYWLNSLKESTFQFIPLADSDISDIRVKKLVLKIRGGGSRTITFEADPNQNPKAIYHLMNEMLSSHSITLRDVDITLASLVVTFHDGGHRTFDVSRHNSCTLQHDTRDLTIRQCLKDSRIDHT